MKVSELSGAALDWAVAKCEGAGNFPKETTWEDVKDLDVPFQMWEVSCNDKGRYWISPITVFRCGVDVSVGATAPSISAVDQKGRAFRGSIRDYYLTALEAENEVRVQTCGDLNNPASYSTNWSKGGPIIERERVELRSYADQWRAVMHLTDDSIFADGPTPLVAAMLCYVASKLGDDIDVPESLL